MPEPPTALRRNLRAPARALALALACASVALALLVAGGPAGAQTGGARAPVVIKDAGQESVIVADQLQQMGGGQDLLIAIGNVELTQGATRLLADRIELNRDTGEAVAQGKVVFFDGPDRLVGERVDYNLKTGTGVVYNGSTSAEPYYRVSGERMDRIGDGVYSVRRGVFTTCEGAEPDWSFRFNAGEVELDEMAYGTTASFWVRNIPLLPYVPFFAAAIRRERQTGFLFPEYGSSTTQGFIAKVPFFWAISDSQDMTVSLNTYSRRGIGVEGEYRYIWSERARGVYNGFLIPEFLRNPQDRQRLGIPETRGFLASRHDWQITPQLSFKVDANATTDDLVFREYADHLADRARQRAETNVFLTQRWTSWSLTGNILWYQDLTTPVATELQRVPEIKLFGVRQPIPGLPGFLYQTEASFTNFYRVVGDSGVRLDVHPLGFYPIPVAGLFTLTPYAGGRLTLYNQQAIGLKYTHTIYVEDSVPDLRVRRQVEAGVEVDTRASRVFFLDGWGGLSAVQHMIQPTAVFRFIRGLDQKANPQWDPAIDNIGRVTQITYAITNRLNAKSIPGPAGEFVRWEAVRLAVSQTFDIDNAIARHGEAFKDMFGTLIIDPNAIFRFRADAQYNVNGLGFRVASTDLTARYRDFSVTFGTRYNNINTTNFIYGEGTWRVLDNLDAHVATNWDVREGTLVEQRFGIDWRFQCFAVTAEYVLRNSGGSDFRFSVNLLGVGQAGSKLKASQ
jgi:LPS-assembly protein